MRSDIKVAIKPIKENHTCDKIESIARPFGIGNFRSEYVFPAKYNIIVPAMSKLMKQTIDANTVYSPYFVRLNVPSLIYHTFR